ncbi:MAG: hypothetical protein WB869_06730 [Candidatus Acidiferrales bacterium]
MVDDLHRVAMDAGGVSGWVCQHHPLARPNKKIHNTEGDRTYFSLMMSPPPLPQLA